MASPLATALMSAEALPKTTIAPTNVVGAYQLAHEAAMDRYKAQLAQKNALWGGLASLAGTVGGAFLGGPAGAAIGAALGKGVSGLFGGGGSAGDSSSDDGNDMYNYMMSGGYGKS